MHPILLTYLLGIPIIAIGIGLVNHKTKYITRIDFVGCNGDGTVIIILFHVIVLFWPFVLVAGIIGTILYGYYKIFVPKD